MAAGGPAAAMAANAEKAAHEVWTLTDAERAELTVGPDAAARLAFLGAPRWFVRRDRIGAINKSDLGLRRESRMRRPLLTWNERQALKAE